MIELFILVKEEAILQHKINEGVWSRGGAVLPRRVKTVIISLVEGL